jgi:hypothetical protein
MLHGETCPPSAKASERQSRKLSQMATRGMRRRDLLALFVSRGEVLKVFFSETHAQRQI